MTVSRYPTPHAEVNHLLRHLLEQVQAVLGTNFVAMYLTGSLALGDFDLDSSDIDFVVVTNDLVSSADFAALDAMHTAFATSDSPWAGKIETVYVPQHALRRYPPPHIQVPQIEKEQTLFLDYLESGWIFQCYTVREYGIVLAGPDPRTWIEPLDPNEMQRAVGIIPEMWLEQLHHDPSWLPWLRHRAHQSFVVLTLCRLLYTLEHGTVASKPAAATWAQKALGSQWTGLIARALVGQHGHETILERDIATTDRAETDLADTISLVEYTVEQFQQWEASLPQLNLKRR